MYLSTHTFLRPRILKKNDRIKNMTGTTSLESKRGSWKKHWTDSGRRKWPKTCQKKGCKNPAEVGAHVKVRNNSRDYIFPLCNPCNQIKKIEMKPKANSAAYSIAKKDIAG